MNLAGIDEGDLIVVEKGAQERVGDIVVALDDNNCNTLKRLAYDKGKRKHYLQAESSNPANHEQGGTRPVLILQNDVGNYYSPTVIVTAATTQKNKKQNLPTHVELENVEGLPDTSVFMLEVLRTIDKRRIRSYAGKLTDEQMDRIDTALRISLRLDEDAYLPTEVEAP